MKRIIFIGGGVRSGKSELALKLARRSGRRRVFVATAEAHDGEMGERIARHRATRGADFETLEEPLKVPELLSRLENVDVVVIDCLTLWLANLLLRGDSQADIRTNVEALAGVLERRVFDAVVVTNEVGMGVVPDSELGRAFRDIAGLAHQRLARVADEVYFGVLGTALRLKPAPVELTEVDG